MAVKRARGPLVGSGKTKPAAKDNNLAEAVFRLLEHHQGFGFICDGMGHLSDAELGDVLRSALEHNKIVAQMLRGFLQTHAARLGDEAGRLGAAAPEPAGWDKSIIDTEHCIKRLRMAIATYQEMKAHGLPWPGAEASSLL